MPSSPPVPPPSTVLIADSGVGGLSVLAEVAARLPGADLIYAADNAFFPYGIKPDGVLIPHVAGLLEDLAARYRPDLVVMACNTASTAALDAVREVLAVPVVGTVPAIKPAAAVSQSRTIGLLGTPATVRQPYTQRLIDSFAADCTVIRHGSRDLVELAEAKLRGAPPDPAALRRVLDGMFEQVGGANIDTVVLACTHFPLLRSELAAIAPRPIQWVDSGAAIAARVAFLLDGTGADAVPPTSRPSRRLAVLTADDGSAHALRPAFARFGLRQVEILAGADATRDAVPPMPAALGMA
ncbi:MAG: glutamate racemase [Inquilinaceae bacterium]